MIEFGIAVTDGPIKHLKLHNVDPGLALAILRFATETRLWKPGKVRRRLLTLLPGQDPTDRRHWMQPDHGLAHPADQSAKPADERYQQQLKRLRQLELEFEPKLRDLPIAEICSRFDLPSSLADRLAGFASWKHTSRSDSLRLQVFEHLARASSN